MPTLRNDAAPPGQTEILSYTVLQGRAIVPTWLTWAQMIGIAWPMPTWPDIGLADIARHPTEQRRACARG